MAAASRKPSVTIDLDTLEREDAPEPFTAQVAGKTYRLEDPAACRWSDLALITTQPGAFIAVSVREEKKREQFLAALNDMPAWKVNKLAGAYREHFGLVDSPEASGSPTS